MGVELPTVYEAIGDAGGIEELVQTDSLGIERVVDGKVKREYSLDEYLG